MGIWSSLVEAWSGSGYRSDYYKGEEGSGKHTHDYYEVNEKEVKSGAVETDEKTGEHTPTEGIR